MKHPPEEPSSRPFIEGPNPAHDAPPRSEPFPDETRERLLSVLHAMDDLIFVFDPEGCFTWHFQPESQPFLYAEPGRFLGKHFREVLPEEVADSLQKAMDQARDSGSIFQFHYRLPIGGREAWYQARIAALKDPQGARSGYTAVIRDITEKNRMENELLRAQNLESLGVLAGGIAHDFNNILTAILGNVNLAKVLVGQEHDAFEKLEKAEQASEIAQGLAQQLLTFSHGGTPVKKPGSLVRILQDAVEMTLRGSGVQCELDLPGDLLPVEVDRGQMHQVFHNLILNAAQAMPSGGILRIGAGNAQVTFTEDLPLAPGKYVKITVKDQGDGIAPEHLGRVFDPYFTTRKMGTGLGLASAFSIVRKHGGHITVDSVRGQGSTFTLYLPAGESGDPLPEEPARPLEKGRGRVLVMDDEEIVRSVVDQMLAHLGYEVDLAKNGPEAVDLFTRAAESGRPFDLVILDLTIHGGWGGVEAVMLLRRIQPEVRAIVASGYSNDPVMAHFQRYGFSGAIRKPFRIDELSKAIGLALEKDPGYVP
jgi:two-component system, cell cycle sensor histidine kinase and response regulator CckA